MQQFDMKMFVGDTREIVARKDANQAAARALLRARYDG